MSGGRTKNSIRNIVYRIVSQITNILLKFVNRTVFIYILGVEYLGINGLFSEILQVLALADLGFGTAMVFSMYKPLAEHDEKKLAQLVTLYKKIYTIIAIAISVIGVSLVPFLKYLVNLDEGIPHLKLYYLLYLANTVSSYLVVYKTCILNADQKNYLISKYDTIFNFISTIVCTLFLYITKNFLIYLIVQVLVTYMRNFYCSHVAQKMYPYINNQVEKLPKEESKQIFENVKSVFVYKFATTLVGSTDNTLISMLVGTKAVGYYSNYSMIISNISLIINMFFSSITASLGNMIVEKNEKKNYQVYKTMQFVSFVLSVVAISCVYILINDFITVWLGSGFVFDNITVIAIVLNMYFSVVLMPIWSYREATGMYQQTKYVMIITVIVNFVLSVMLGKIIGLAGILFATSIARLSTYFWYEPKLLFAQFFKQKVSEYYKNIGINVLVTIIVTGMMTMIFNDFFVSSWIGFAGKTILVAIVSLVLTLLLYCRNAELKKVFNIAKSLLVRK